MAEQGLKGIEPECRDVRVLLDALGEADPSPQALARISEHLAHCDNCAGAEHSLEDVLVLYRGEGNIAVPGGLEQRLLDCMCGENKELAGPPEAASGSK